MSILFIHDDFSFGVTDDYGQNLMLNSMSTVVHGSGENGHLHSPFFISLFFSRKPFKTFISNSLIFARRISVFLHSRMTDKLEKMFLLINLAIKRQFMIVQTNWIEPKLSTVL